MKTNAAKKRIKAYRKRRKKAHRIIQPQESDYQLIDGNYSKYIVGYCGYRKGYLTLGLYDTHKCHKCKSYKELSGEL